MNTRRLLHRIKAIETADGAGVCLRRSIGAVRTLSVDPFLLLDEFSSDDPDDYIAGFPAHPHRGFETVTYMLDGVMRHQDHLGHCSDLGPGDVQWMRAGRGIIHSEMPQQRNGRMRGFQLWINLPASEKMSPAAYRNIEAADIPVIRREDGSRLHVIAGALDWAGQAVAGAMNSDRSHATDPFLLDLAVAPRASAGLPLPPGHQALIYVFEGELERIGEQAAPLLAHQAGVLSNGDLLQVEAGGDGARLLVLAARPIREPVVQHGPFVMNTRSEIEQAINDYREGRLTA